MATDTRDPLTHAIIGCAIAVHTEMGPGLLEAAYDDCLARELGKTGMPFVRQPVRRISYQGSLLDKTYRPDFIVNAEVVVEVKSVVKVLPLHVSQTLTYMKLSEIERGLLLNFNVPLMIHGIRRLILSR
jgi:GxxExxY protein